MPVEKTIEPAEAKYVIKKTDPAYSMLRSVAMGIDCMKPGTTVGCPKPFLNTLAIEMTISGSALLHYGDRQVQHRPGSLMLMLPELKFFEIAENTWRSCWFVLWGPLAQSFVAAVGRTSTAIAIERTTSQVRFDMFEACRLILEQPTDWQWIWLKHLLSVLQYVHDNCVQTENKQACLATRACELMEKNLAAPLQLTEISEMLNVSLSTFSHQFRKETGLSPGLKYRHLRMDKARQLLANGLSVTETSENMGFDNPFHFSRAFKKIEGICPSEFRKLASQLRLKDTTR